METDGTDAGQSVVPNDLVLDLTDEEVEELERWARKAGVGVEEYARGAIRRHLRLDGQTPQSRIVRSDFL